MSAPNLSGDDTATHPLRAGAAVTPSDSTILAAMTRGVYVGTGGNLNVDMADGMTLLIPSVPAGAFMPIRVTRIRSTSTTASGIVAFW